MSDTLRSATPQPPLSPSLVGPDTGASLDTRILHAEQRLIARDEAVQRQVRKIGARVREAAKPSRLVAPLLGAMLAGAALWWWLRGKPAAPAVSARSGPDGNSSAAARSSGHLPWLHWLSAAWPMLPASWRAGISPATFSTVASVAVPVVEQLFASKPSGPPLRTVASVDLPRFAGTWHEIARLPAPFEAACDGQPSATYLPRSPGLIDVVNRCHARDGRVRSSHGVAKVVEGSGGAKLEVSLFPRWLRWLPFAWADYWILHLDDAYTVALVGHPSRRYLWVLARRTHLQPPLLRALVDLAQAHGFAVERLKIAQPD